MNRSYVSNPSPARNMYSSIQFFFTTFFLTEVIREVLAPITLDPSKYKGLAVEAEKVQNNGKTGEAAELALLNFDLNFVNYDSREMKSAVLSMIFDYNRIKSGHEIKVNQWKFDELAEKEDAQKVNVCRAHFNEPFLKEAGFDYDKSAAVDQIKLVSKQIVYRFHGKAAEMQLLIQCPFVFDNRKAGYLYFSTAEKPIQSAGSDEYYYVFTEYRKPPTNEVCVLMRSKFNAAFSLTEFTNTVKKLKNSFLNYIQPYLTQIKLEEPESDYS